MSAKVGPSPSGRGQSEGLTAKHPLAGQTMTGADMVIQVLADEGVELVFGYSGGAILPTWDALVRYNIEQGLIRAAMSDQQIFAATSLDT